jgi:hypothetical protein
MNRAALILGLLLAAGCGSNETKSRPRDEAASRAAFMRTYPVFMHARCMNCHPAGDAPLQGDASTVHFQNVQRGPDGKGKFAMKCAACHQDENTPGLHMPPGNPNWHLPPSDMPMVFERRTPRQLARQFKDPKQNGGKTLAQILEHVEKDGLVKGGWNPGDGRALPPLSHEEFARAFREWVETGAVDPED